MNAKPTWWGRRSRRAGRADASQRPAHASEPDQSQSRQFTHLPERVDPKDVVASQRADPSRDPEGGRDTDRDFLLRYGAGGDDDLWDLTDG
jgi:hypothetical protein